MTIYITRRSVRSELISRTERIFSPDGWHSMIILPTRLRTDIVKKRNRAGGIVCYQLMNLALCDGTTPKGPGERPVSRKSPRALTMARRPTNFEKDKNKK